MKTVFVAETKIVEKATITKASFRYIASKHESLTEGVRPNSSVKESVASSTIVNVGAEVNRSQVPTSRDRNSLVRHLLEYLLPDPLA